MRFTCWGALSVLVLVLAAAASPSPADAARTLLSEAALETAECARCPTPEPGPAIGPVVPPAEGQIEGPCGLAVSPSGRLYLADYYHRVIDIFKAPISGFSPFAGQIPLFGSNPVFGVNTLDSVCGLAFDSSGSLYGNEWHQGVLQLTPNEVRIDSGESTGLAIDRAANRLYVDDRTYVAEYALPYSPGAEPLAKIGLGKLAEGYGLAAFGGRVYVADAADNKVKVFEPATSASAPVATIAGQFNSLAEAALAIDPGNGHLLVVDNRQPGFEHPKSAVLEFASVADGYAFLGALPGAPIDGGPSGIAITPGGEVLVTDGNSELANAFLYGPYEAAASSVFATPTSSAAAVPVDAPSQAGGEAGPGPAARRRSPRSATASEVVQSGGVRVSFQGSLAPKALPRRGRKPITASVGATIIPLGEGSPPQLRRIEIAINRNGRFAPAALPVCHMAEIQPATTSAALAACRRSLVGEGTFSARILLPQQAPFPSAGKIYAFNARWQGRPAILAHVYGSQPVPTSFTLPFVIGSMHHGTFGTVLTASLPHFTTKWGYVTGISLSIGSRGTHSSYLTAGCPAPPGFGRATFRLLRTSLAFSAHRPITQTLLRSCRVQP